ncbi:SRPBCC family protein [Microbacterium sp. NPDC089698]|uniref:SRPBCC family protein n=1 Tax=Microbacterium sp. NPDC089698 TaxID=3364200 RepID=UPI003821E986
MAHTVVASVDRTIAAPAEAVYRYVSATPLHAELLPHPFYDFRLEEGDVGEGSVASYKIKFAGGVRQLRMRVTEPEPGRTVVHTDLNGSGLVTTFTIAPHGDQARVNIVSRFDGETGVAGFVERIAAPIRLRRVHAKELARLDARARRATDLRSSALHTQNQTRTQS